MLTPIDHWLRERFIFQTHFYTMRLPDRVPRGIKVRELPESASNRFRYRLISNSNKKSDRLVAKFNEEGLMFSTQVVESKTPLKPLIAPKGKSVLLSIFWLFTFIGLVLGIWKLSVRLINDEVFMANFWDAVSIFREN